MLKLFLGFYLPRELSLACWSESHGFHMLVALRRTTGHYVQAVVPHTQSTTCNTSPSQTELGVGGWDVVHLVERRTGSPLTQVQFPGAARDFLSPDSTCSADSLSVLKPTCAIACINICAHVKDPAVRVRVRWIMETLKHPAYTVGWIARLCRSCLSPAKATRISHGRNNNGTIQL